MASNSITWKMAIEVGRGLSRLGDRTVWHVGPLPSHNREILLIKAQQGDFSCTKALLPSEYKRMRDPQAMLDLIRTEISAGLTQAVYDTGAR